MAPTSLDNSYDGLATFHYPLAQKPLQTYYRVFGNLKGSGKTPLVVVHGGPGLSHDYLLNYSHLTTHHNIPIILYDQIGSGRSTRLPETKGREGFWIDEIFLQQLTQLVENLGIEKNYDVLGSSWGGMMASRFASRRPAGLSKLILSNSAASKAASLANRWIYRREMSEEHQEILECNEKAGTTGSEEYGRVMAMFTKEHICNVESPEDWDVSAKFAREDDTVAKDMGDNTFWFSSGYMQTWDTGEESKNINVPVLVINGIKEFASGDAVVPFLDNIPDVRLVTLEGTTHSPHFERMGEYMRVVGEFLEGEP